MFRPPRYKYYKTIEDIRALPNLMKK
jgi:hypothetical protein